METISIILVLVDVRRDPIKRLCSLINYFLMCARWRGLQSFAALQAFKSHHNINQPLLYGPTNQMETISIILVLVGMMRDPIEWLD
jgi:hypothetical protein